MFKSISINDFYTLFLLLKVLTSKRIIKVKAHFLNLNFCSNMNITFEELRDVKHRLPHGSVSKIAQDLNLSEQTVRNYFGAADYQNGEIIDRQIQPGPHGGIIHLEDTSIYEAAQKILHEQVV